MFTDLVNTCKACLVLLLNQQLSNGLKSNCIQQCWLLRLNPHWSRTFLSVFDYYTIFSASLKLFLWHSLISVFLVQPKLLFYYYNTHNFYNELKSVQKKFNSEKCHFLPHKFQNLKAPLSYGQCSKVLFQGVSQLCLITFIMCLLTKTMSNLKTL